MTVELPILEGAATLTHSSESTYRACPRKFFLRYRLGLRPAHDSDALRLGSAFHVGLESLKSGKGEAHAREVVRGLYADAECPPWLTPDEFAVEEHTALALVVGYARRYANDAILEYVAVEQSFELPIVNPDTGHPSRVFRTAGKIDGIARLPDGRLAIIEHKTCGDSIEPGSDYWRRLLMDSQISRYFLAARALGFDVQTVVYDVVRKPQIKPKAITKADRGFAQQRRAYFGLALYGPCPERETPAMFGARLIDDLAQRPERSFARMEIPRLESDLDQFQREQWTLKDIIKWSVSHERERGLAAWPRNTAACIQPYRCPYLDICRGFTANPTEEVPSGFRLVTSLHEELKPGGRDAA